MKPRAVALLRALLGITAFAAVILAAPRAALAGDIEDFQAARALYEAHDWPRAIAAFEALVGGETPTLESQPLVLESRKYLAAAYVFDGRERAAADQFERLLTEEPTYELDATQFPREVVQLFDRVRTRLAERREAETARAELEAEVVRLRAENETLRAEASGERVVEVPREQWLMFLPFGVGQFVNDEEGLGWFFAVTEALAGGAMIGLLIAHQALVAVLQDNGTGVDRALWERVNDALDIVEPLSWSSTALLAGFAIAGVIQANVAFTPTRSVRVPPPPSVSLRVGPLFVGITGSF